LALPTISIKLTFESAVSPQALAINPSAQPRRMQFGSALDLLRHLAVKTDDRSFVQRLGQDSLQRNPSFLSWKALRTPLRAALHFRRYRQASFDNYHEASRALALGKATPEQECLARGLAGEISGSHVKIPRGQTLFHGRADDLIGGGVRLRSFLSTSLCPVVAINSAVRRAHQTKQRPRVHIISCTAEIPALWGHTNKSAELELLVSAGALFGNVAVHTQRNWTFDIAEAELAGIHHIWP